MESEDVPNGGPDLLFAWLSPIETKVDRRRNPKSSSFNVPAGSPFVTRARTAIRRTVKASHVTGSSSRKTKGAKDMI